MFRAAYRSSSGAQNCICSLWFTYTFGDRPLSSLRLLLKAQHVSSGIPLIIRSSKLYLQPLVYIHIWWPAVVKSQTFNWKLNMFRAAYRSSSGAPNCICSLWFTYTCGDRPLSSLRLLLKAQHVSSGIPLIIRSSKFYLQPLVYIHMWWPASNLRLLLRAQHVSSGIPLIIRSSKLYLQPLVYIHIWWPAVVKSQTFIESLTCF